MRARPPTTLVNILSIVYLVEAAVFATVSIHNIAYTTDMRLILGQSVYHLNLFHGFRHISMPKAKFPIWAEINANLPRMSLQVS